MFWCFSCGLLVPMVQEIGNMACGTMRRDEEELGFEQD